MYTLMIKTHNITNLKYLCKTKKDNIYKYHGSGSYWKKHIKKHGLDIHTEVIYQTDDLDDFIAFCVKYSNENNVVESKEWANLMHENGSTGGLTHSNPHWLSNYRHSESTKKIISEHSKKSNQKRKDEGYIPYFLGKTHTEATKIKMSKSSLGKKKTIEHRENIKKSKLGKKLNLTEQGRDSHSSKMSSMLKTKYICSVCNKSGNAGHMTRYHKICKGNDNWKISPLQ